MTWLAAKRYSSFCKKFTYSIQSYDLELKIDPRRLSYTATASITLTADKNTRQFCFLLSDQCELGTVTYLGISLSHTIKPAHPGLNLVTSTLPRKADVGEKLVIVFIYSGNIPNFGGESMELPPSMHWYPYSLCSKKYTCTLKIVTPEIIRTVGVGNLTNEQPADTRVMTQWTADIPFRGIHLLAGEFLKTSRDTQPTLDVYYPRKYLNQGKNVADNGEKLLDFFSDKLGPAPAPSNVFILSDSTEEYTNSSFYITSISGGILEQLRDYKSTKDKNIRLFQITSRELAHRWLKYNFAVIHPSHLWYLDGLAEYLSWLALEEEFGTSVREQVMEEARTLIQAEANQSIVQKAYGVSQEFPRWLVDKASWLMRIAHCLTGESFLPALKDFFASTSQSQYAPSPEEFFVNLGCLTGTDCPQLYKEWAQSDSQLEVVITEARTFQDDLGQWQLLFNLGNQGKLIWPYPVEIRMDLADGSTQVHSLLIEKEPHLIESPAKIMTMTIDPDMKFLNWASNSKYNL